MADRDTPADTGTQIGESLAAWAEQETRETQCVAKREGCVKAFTQVRPKVMKGQAWKQPICPSCQAALDQSVAEDEARDAREQSLKARFHVLEVPPLYAEVSFDNFKRHGDAENQQQQDRLIAACSRFVAEWPEVPSIVLFMGGSRTGKGHLAWAIAKAIVTEKGDAVRFVSLPDLIRELREGWNNPAAEPESLVLERYREPPLLIIDEVSRHAYYGEPTPHLYHLINHRLNWKRPTILTTNEDADSLREALSGPLLSRIEAQRAVWDFGQIEYGGGNPWL